MYIERSLRTLESEEDKEDKRGRGSRFEYLANGMDYNFR